MDNNRTKVPGTTIKKITFADEEYAQAKQELKSSQRRIICMLFFAGYSKTIKDRTSDTSDTIESYGSGSILNNLTSALLDNYGAGVRPYCPPSHTIVNVSVDIAIHQLISLSEPDQIVQFNVWMRLGWIDCHLKWNPDNFNGTETLVLPMNLIWIPDISLYESISEEFYGYDNFRAQISSDGYVSYKFPTKVEALCPIDVAKFPYDSQICTLTFGSWSYNGFQLDLKSVKASADLSSAKENVEWIIEKAPVRRHEIYYGCCPEPYPDVTFYVHLRRKPQYYVSNIIVPSILVTFVASFGFLLPVDSGEKVGLELTVMLAMSVFQLLVADHLPPSAESTPWIGIFFSFTLFLCGISSLWQVMVLNIHYRGDRPMPPWTQYYILKPLAYVTCVSLPRIKNLYKSSHKQDKRISRLFQVLDMNRRSKEEDTGSSTTISKSEVEIDNSELWMKLSLVLDRIGLVIFWISLTIGLLYIFVGIHS